MSLLKEYQELEEQIKKDAEIRAKHYNSVDLTGTRTFNVDAAAARQRIAEMKKLREQG